MNVLETEEKEVIVKSKDSEKGKTIKNNRKGG